MSKARAFNAYGKQDGSVVDGMCSSRNRDAGVRENVVWYSSTIGGGEDVRDTTECR